MAQQRWHCDYCPSVFKTQKNAEDHEQLCSEFHIQRERWLNKLSETLVDYAHYPQAGWYITPQSLSMLRRVVEDMKILLQTMRN